MELKKVIEVIEGHISSLQKIMPAEEQHLDLLRDVNIKTVQLIRSLFSDSSERVKDFSESMDKASHREAKGFYTEQAKVQIRYLSAIKDELLIRMASEESDTSLMKLKKEVGLKEIEADRREAVTETKFYGAAIEIIDRLRTELRDKGKLAEDVVSLRTEIREIKEMLNGIANKKQ